MLGRRAGWRMETLRRLRCDIAGPNPWRADPAVRPPQPTFVGRGLHLNPMVSQASLTGVLPICGPRSPRLPAEGKPEKPVIINLLHWLGVALMLATLWAAVQFDGIPTDRFRLEDGNETPESDSPALHLPRGWPGASAGAASENRLASASLLRDTSIMVGHQNGLGS
jgi:hypothetical protein